MIPKQVKGHLDETKAAHEDEELNTSVIITEDNGGDGVEVKFIRL